MNIFIYFLLSLAVLSAANADEIAVCGPTKGNSYFNHMTPVPKSKSGYVSDSIPEYRNVLSINSKGEYDIEFTDSRGKIRSSKGEGAKIFIVRADEKEIAILSHYIDTGTIEIFNYFQEDDKSLRYTMYTNRGGKFATISKTSMLYGSCSKIKFNNVR